MRLGGRPLVIDGGRTVLIGGGTGATIDGEGLSSIFIVKGAGATAWRASPRQDPPSMHLVLLLFWFCSKRYSSNGVCGKGAWTLVPPEAHRALMATQVSSSCTMCTS